MRRKSGVHFVGRSAFCATLLMAYAGVCFCQDTPPPRRAGPATSGPGLVRELDVQVKELRAALAQMTARIDQMQARTTELETELQATRSDLAALSDHRPTPNSLPNITDSSLALAPDASASTGNSQTQNENRIAKLEEDQQLLDSKINEQYQSKVESASKYRVRLSGIALLNVFANRGAVDKLDVPTWARASGPGNTDAAFGATVRQSTVGLDVSGPDLAGAKTRGEIQMDFFGGVPSVANGITAGEMRMRIATVRMDWKDSSIIAGQDVLFFSPLNPTSFASLADPALSYAGNLWTWTPQIRVEHQIHFSDTAGVIVQGGILDPLSGEPPNNAFFRSPQAGERAGQPAYATRLAWTQTVFGRPLTVGAGGYYSRQNWGFDRIINGWAGTADWNIPLGRWFTLSGEFYRGRAIGGLGGGLGRSVIYNGSLDSATTSVRGLNAVGGWGQITFQPTERLEFNAAFGEDNPLAADFRHFNATQSYISSSITRNRSALANVIFHPRSNLIWSLEYRRLSTFETVEGPYNANQINLGIGVLF
jgi:hypothetical protein